MDQREYMLIGLVPQCPSINQSAEESIQSPTHAINPKVITRKTPANPAITLLLPQAPTAPSPSYFTSTSYSNNKSYTPA